MLLWMLRSVLFVQLIFSSVATAFVSIKRERLLKAYSLSNSTFGAICWGIAYWGKSALIATAIIYGPEKNHWVMGYILAASVIFAIGDVGLLVLWTVHEPNPGS